ncbi:MAG: glycosyltransferase [Pirellulales bacterium]|nr:glycosyltransferase [Pirellulales bacterium]
MDSFWLAAYLVLAGVALVQSVLLTVQAWEHRRFVRSRMGRLGSERPTGHAAVFAPCKGVDVGLEDNLRALLQQDYDDYEVTFIVESADDPACPVVQRLIAEHPCVACRLVVAGRATHSGQKVHNLRAATARLGPQVKYLAFLDSDARPRSQWLRSLTAILSKTDCRAVTGYRWFIPDRSTLANYLLYSMNCGVMSLFGRTSHYLVWGGSWGIRRDVFDSIGLHGAWKGTLSDDLVATRLLRRAKVPVRFEPACVVASPLDYSLAGVLSFLRRQYMVARFYTPDWWLFGLLATTFTSLAWLGNLAALGCSLVLGAPSLWMPASVCGLLYLLSVHRGMVRQGLVGTYFPDRRRALRACARIDTWANPIVGWISWLGVLASMWGRQIAWRGIRYHLALGGRIRSVQRDDGPPSADEPAAAGDQSDDELQTVAFPTRETVPYRKAG